VSLSRLAVGRPVAVAMLTLAGVFLGVISFVRLPIDLLPSIAYPRLVIHTRYSDVGPTEVERFVTEPIEQAVGRVPGVEHVESVSREGMSLVTLRFSWGTDMDFAALNVREQLDNIRDQLPELASRPVVLRTDPNAEPILALSVSGGDLAGLKDLSETVFKRRLEQIDGIAEAALTGGLEREIHVEVDPRLLETFGLTVEDVSRALDAANQSAPGGTVRRGRYRYALRTLGEFQSVDEISNVPIGRLNAGTGGGLVLLRDVADVSDGFKDRESVARYQGHEAVGLLLFKESGANTVRVTQRVEEVLDQLRRQYPDMDIAVATAQAGFISDAISNVVQALVFGGILAFLVLFLFLHDPRYPVAIALAIPISVAVTFALLDLTGVSLNIMSLGGLALGVGMLVDNSIVVLENIFRHRELGLSASEAAAKGAEEVQTAVTASTLTTVAVFAPIIYVEGVAGELFGDLSIAVASALIVSLVVALTLLPAMAARWNGSTAAAQRSLPARIVARLTRPVTQAIGSAYRTATAPIFTAFDRMFASFAEWYHRLLTGALEGRGRVVALAVGALAVGVALGATLDRAVLPQVEQGEFTVRLTLPRGTPLEETEATAGRIEAAAAADPDVETVFSRVGRQAAVAGVEDEESGLHTAQVTVHLVAGARTPDVVERIRGQLGGMSRDVLAVETGTATALGRLLGGEDADLAIRFRGDDLDVLRGHVALALRRLQEVPELTNVRLRSEEGQPEIRIEVERERAAAYGIEPRRIAETVERYMRGAVATEYVDFDEKVPVVVRLPEAQRRSLQTLQELTIDGVPLRELVTTYEEVGPGEVRHRDQGRVIEIYADRAGVGLDESLVAIRSALRDVPPPRGVRVELGGANEERARSFRDLAFAFGLALILVYMILAAQFESFVHPFTILLAVPLSIVGATVALYLTGEGLNTMSLIGVVILVGIVVNDAIVKVEFINQLRAQGASIRDAILEAGQKRLRPILMTTVTTVLGLLPMALGFGRGADLRQPLAIVVIGGLTSATVLTLIVIPVAYSLISDVRVLGKGGER